MNKILDPRIMNLGSHADLRRSKPMFEKIRTGTPDVKGSYSDAMSRFATLGTFEQRNQKVRKECQSSLMPNRHEKDSGFGEQESTSTSKIAPLVSAFPVHDTNTHGTTSKTVNGSQKASNASPESA